MKYLSIDLGSKTLGLAKGQGTIASPWKTLTFTEHSYSAACQLLLKVIREYQPDKLIIGYPLNMNGTVGSSAQQVLEFKNMLSDLLPEKLEIILIDERLSTFSANQILINANLSREKRKKIKDHLAAAIILQTYFDKLLIIRKRAENEQ